MSQFIGQVLSEMTTDNLFPQLQYINCWSHDNRSTRKSEEWHHQLLLKSQLFLVAACSASNSSIAHFLLLLLLCILCSLLHGFLQFFNLISSTKSDLSLKRFNMSPIVIHLLLSSCLSAHGIWCNDICSS